MHLQPLENDSSDNQSLNLNFSKADRENPLKSFTVQFDGRRSNAISDRDVKSNFQSLVDLSKNTLYNRHYSSRDNTINLGGSMDYSGIKRLLFRRFNLFGINLNLSQRLNYISQTEDDQIADYDSTAKRYITNNKLTNINKRELVEYTPSLALSKSISKYSDVFYRNLNMQVRFLNEFKADKNTSSINERNIARSFEFFRYEGNVTYSYTKQRKYNYYMNMGYNKNFDYPSIDQLYTIVDDINVYDTRIGNAFLLNRINNTYTINGNFNTQKPNAVYAVNSNFNAGYTKATNPVVDSTINDPSGRRVSYFTNADESSNKYLNYSFRISRKIKKNSLQFVYDGRINNNNSPNYVDGFYNISATNSLYNNLTLQYTMGSILVLNVGESFQHYKTSQTAAGLTAFKNGNKNMKLGAVLNYPTNFTFSSTLDRVDNSNLSKTTNLWNLFGSYRFLKQQGELKFAAMDILRQYQNISNSVSAYGTTTRITNGLQQYFLLTFSYYPRKFGKTELRAR